MRVQCCISSAKYVQRLALEKTPKFVYGELQICELRYSVGDGGLVGGGGDSWSSILVLTSEWSTMILPTKICLIIILLLSLSLTSLSLSLSSLLSLSFTLSLSLSLSSLLLLSFQGKEWLPENQRRLATPPVNRQTRAPWRDSEDQAYDDFEDRLVSGGGDARRGIPARRALWGRGRCRPTWRHLVVSWWLPRTRHRFWPIPGLGDEKILLPMALILTCYPRRLQ